mgnify:CR=1 FL=1
MVSGLSRRRAARARPFVPALSDALVEEHIRGVGPRHAQPEGSAQLERAARALIELPVALAFESKAA